MAKKTREQILDEAKAKTDAKLARRAARAEQQRAAAAADRQLRLQAGNEQFSRDAINRQRLQSTAPRNTRAAQARPLPQVRSTAPLNPADMTAAQRFAANPAGGIQGRVRGAPRPLPPAPPKPPAAQRALRMFGPGAFAMEAMLHAPEARAPMLYPSEEQETLGMSQEEMIQQLMEAGIAEPELTVSMLMDPHSLGRMDALQAPDPFDNEFLNYDAAASTPEQRRPMSRAEPAPDPFDNEFLNYDAASFTPEQLAAMEADYFDMDATEAPSMLEQFVSMMDSLGAQADAERYDERINEAVNRPDLVGPLPDESPAMLEDVPDYVTNYDQYGIISPDELREQIMREYIAGQQQADPRQRRVLGSADEFAANRPEPRMSQQQLENYLRMIARDESINAGLAGDPFAGYDESLLPEGAQVAVDPATGFTSFEGNQEYVPDAALTGRQSMDDLRLDTEYTSRALRNVGRAQGVPSPQEVERRRLLSTLSGEARGQGIRADQLAEQMQRTRSGLNSQNLTPLELQAAQTQLETQGAELAAARGGAEQARRLQLQGALQPPFPAPEDVELQQLQQVETARAQAQAVADQRRLLKEMDIAGRNQVDAQDMERYAEMFASMEPSAVPEGMPLTALDEDMQAQEQGRINRIQIATTLAGMREEFRTQPALALHVSRILGNFPPEEQAKAIQWLSQQDDLGAALAELEPLGGM